ncbi:LVIVD repeat-containing protein [Nonomuraea sp. NPDC050540]|uniref:LVIVD repeat-containing protein n=1 Tax=Nonomuraea sp. NPDC050540 TaxID=3364367 RepID=UPI0037A93011
MIPAKLRAAVVGAAVMLVAACAGAPAARPGPSAASKAPSSASPSAKTMADVTTSDNVKLVANMPRTAPLDGPMSWNSDLAFQGNYAFVGNFGGFSIFDISDPAQPKPVSQVSCPAQQNDVSVYGDLLILSIDEPRGGEKCDSGQGTGPASGGWEGLRIFDISDKKNPTYVSAVRTDCGSHTHTMVPGKNPDTLYVYVSSPGPEPDSKTCPPPHELIQIVEIPVKNPKSAKIVAKPNIFPDGQGEGMFAAGCHDITAYPEKNLAAAACFGDGVLLDIADPVKPKVLQQVRDTENFQIWHSATFNNDATKVVFSDELGGGGMATCDSKTPKTKGANAIYDIVDGKLERRGYFKMPREQTSNENCVAHNGSLLPIEGKDVMVQAWYQGGVSVWDFTDSNNPREVGFFDRGPAGGDHSIAGSWSAYYYNGYIYSSDILKGLDVIQIDDPLTDPAKQVKMDDFNVQTQKSY